MGKLDDTIGDDNPRERFRLYLKENANEVGQIRDYIGESLRNTGSQYNRAFQDLINSARVAQARNCRITTHLCKSFSMMVESSTPVMQ